MKKPIPFGKYYLLDRISVGGMAEVFKAKAFGVEGFERLIAVKRILPSIAEDEEFITMFIDEAKIAVQLQHANIAQIFDLGKVGDSYFIALEFVPGRDLRSIFDKLRKSSQAIPISMAGYVTMKVCEGLDYAHNKKDAAGRDLNLVHRDVSPQNVLISYDGEVKLIDFGIAKAAGKAGKTQAGILKGKFGYMSPEQVRGLPLDRRSDIFSVGICLWETITGERLFVGESDFSTLEKVRNVEITPPSSYNKRIPEDLEKIVLKALSREVEDRYQSAMDLHDDLQSWMYTSGSFFARKDLASFMHEVFREDIDRDASRSEAGIDLVRSTVPPPPKGAPRPGGIGRSIPAKPGAPSPRTSQPPPPPPRASKSNPPSGRVPPPQGYSASPGRIAGPPQPNKRTLHGIPQQGVSSGFEFESPTKPHSLPPDLVAGRVATPIAAKPNLAMGDWDDEEPPTNIYSKEAAAEMAKAALAQARAQAKPPLAQSPPVGRRPESGLSSIEDMDAGGDSTATKTVQRSEKTSGMSIAVFAVVLLAIAAAAAFWFIRPGKGAIQLAVTPESGLQVIVDGSQTLPGSASPFIIPELSPGQHTVTIKAEGYKDEHIKIELGGGEILTKQVELVRNETGFFLETDPPGASVWVDEIPQDDQTPITVRNLKPGTHKVRVAKGDKYAQKVIDLEIQAGKITQIPQKTLDLKEVEVTFQTDPVGARSVLLSGNERKVLGGTPSTALLDTSQSYKIQFSKDGFHDQVIPVEYPAGQEKVTLEPTKLVANEEAEHRGSSKAVVKKHREPSTAPAVAATPSSATPSSATATPTTATPSATGAMGSLSVQTKPWSKVFINGQFIKNTPLVNHPLKAGTYQITVENPSYNIKKDFSVTIKAGKPTTVVRTLI